MFKALSKIITSWPVKVISFALILTLIFAVGVRNNRMATGNETLIENGSEVYKNNLSLESEFGGESIIVMFEGKETGELLTADNLNNMSELENMLRQYDEIYTIVSPATIVKQMSGKQYDKYKTGIQEVADGLKTMGSKLKEIGNTVNSNSSNQPSLPNMDEKIAELNNGLAKMIEGQEKLKEGTASLVKGYSTFGTQLKEVSVNLQNFSNNIKNSPAPANEKQQQVQQLTQISTQLLQAAQKMTMISENSDALPTVPGNTISGLHGIKTGLNNQMNELNSMAKGQAGQLKDMKNLGAGLSDMGDKLMTISENLGTMISYSDGVTPSIPTSQKTLDKMVYDDNGNIRSIFDELIINDKYMMFMVKLNGNVDDTAKSNITTSIKEFVKENPMDSIEITVSGKPVLDNAIRTSMKDSMKKMMGLSVIFMIIVLFITFRVKWKLLPLITILVALIGTIGVMGWLNIPVTMVSMAVFPILIGLGIDYAIQFQSRYLEEMEVE